VYRKLLLLAALWVGAALPMVAQARARLDVEVNQGTLDPSVKVLGLLGEARWQEALDDAFVVRLGWRVELWRDRTLFDQNVREVKFDIVIQRDPLLGQYQYTLFQDGNPPTDAPPFTELATFAALVEQPIRIDRFAPTDEGSYYYSVTLEVSALDDDEFAEMRRFMGSGDGGSLLDAVRGSILKWVGIPSQTFSTRSTHFQR
jgi:hypothetical protein